MNRHCLPDRRASITFDVEAFNQRFTVTSSPFADSSIGEIFIQSHKADSSAGIMASDSAVAASLALQFGCPAEVLRKSLSHEGPLAAALDVVLNKIVERP